MHSVNCSVGAQTDELAGEGACHQNGTQIEKERANLRKFSLISTYEVAGVHPCPSHVGKNVVEKFLKSKMNNTSYQ